MTSSNHDFAIQDWSMWGLNRHFKLVSDVFLWILGWGLDNWTVRSRPVIWPARSPDLRLIHFFWWHSEWSLLSQQYETDSWQWIMPNNANCFVHRDFLLISNQRDTVPTQIVERDLIVRLISGLFQVENSFVFSVTATRNIQNLVNMGQNYWNVFLVSNLKIILTMSLIINNSFQSSEEPEVSDFFIKYILLT